MSRIFSYFCRGLTVAVVAAGLLAVCNGLVPAASAAAAVAPATAAPSGPNSPTYKLGSGDKVRVTVFGEDDLGGEFTVDGNGNVRLPLVGPIVAGGLSVLQFEDEVQMKLSDGFLKSPRVNVEVLNYRPFYIVGEVNKPGEYPYVNGMTVLNAIALAGGYTYRASDTSVYVRHNGDSKEQGLPADETTKIGPGDIIRIPERFF